MFAIKANIKDFRGWHFKVDKDRNTDFIVITYNYADLIDMDYDDGLPFKFFYKGQEMEEENCCILFDKDVVQQFPQFIQSDPAIIPQFIEYLKSLGFKEIDG